MAIMLVRDINKIILVDFSGGNHFIIANIGFSDSVVFDWSILEIPDLLTKQV
jgi:hypothetical protein